jgi:hypothetical protein
VRVHAALTLTEMVSAEDSVKAAVSPQVGKVIQGLTRMHMTARVRTYVVTQTC